jgi:sugar/nucleoside kinase (ribokinase family)
MTTASTASSRQIPFDLIGIGSPIMDLLALVPEEFLTTVAGEKGGMVLVDTPEMEALVARLPVVPIVIPGGSAANTAQFGARLGLRTTFLGKLGNDAVALAYRGHFADAGIEGTHFKTGDLPNARCLSLITPDSQRTLRTNLAAAMTLRPDEITPADFAGCRHAHMEGYLFFNPALATAVVDSVRAAGATLSVDLASFEVVRVAREWIFGQLQTGIDVVFANEDEVRTLFESEESYDVLARRLASFGGTACVKLGKDGAWIARADELHRIPPVLVDTPVDTTGAGDAWAAGFLFGHLNNWPAAKSGALGSALGAATVRHIGHALPPAEWERIRALLAPLASA